MFLNTFYLLLLKPIPEMSGTCFVYDLRHDIENPTVLKVSLNCQGLTWETSKSSSSLGFRKIYSLNSCHNWLSLLGVRAWETETHISHLPPPANESWDFGSPGGTYNEN